MIIKINSIAKHDIQIKNGTMINVNASLKGIMPTKIYYSWNPRTYICENSRYLKSILVIQ